jgi:hypothetical protein
MTRIGELGTTNIKRKGGFCLSKSWKPLQLPKNFQDMSQVQLATQSHILNPCFVNKPNPHPFHRSYGTHFVVWPFNKPTPLPVTPIPLFILSMVFHTNTSHIVFLRSMLQLLVTANVVPSSPILVSLMMEALHSIETSVFTGATWRNIPEDDILPQLYLE